MAIKIISISVGEQGQSAIREIPVTFPYSSGGVHYCSRIEELRLLVESWNRQNFIAREVKVCHTYHIVEDN